MKQLELSATIRKTRATGRPASLRREGMSRPCFTDPVLSRSCWRSTSGTSNTWFRRATSGGRYSSLSIQNGGSATKPAVIKELQTHPVTGQFLHVDFYEIDMNRKLRVMVPMVPKGKAKGEEFGGMLQIIEREIEVFCLPQEIPDSLELDVSELGIGEALHVKDIALPAGVELPPGENYTVVTVVSPKAEAAPAARAGRGRGGRRGRNSPRKAKREAAAG